MVESEISRGSMRPVVSKVSNQEINITDLKIPNKNLAIIDQEEESSAEKQNSKEMTFADMSPVHRMKAHELQGP
jgi:hypothetical protein